MNIITQFEILKIIIGLLGISLLIYTKPLHQIFILILMYLIGGILLSYLDFYYLGLTYIIVYVGAIAILFIFLIMMIIDSNSNSNSK